MPTSSVTDRIRLIPEPEVSGSKEQDAGEGQHASSPYRLVHNPKLDSLSVNSATALAVRGLSKSYLSATGRATVLTDVSFAIPSGQAVALVGANGSGKSTALRCALRLIEPTAGDSLLNGQSLTELHGKTLRRARSRVGFVFQKHNLSTRLTVLSNVLHGGLARGIRFRAWTHSIASRAERERALDCLDQVGLADLAGRRADRLSGGQSQRVAIARALMQGPTMIFADEPAASLDPKAGEDVMALFADLCRRTGLTLVVVSHNLEQALCHADRVIGLQAGRVVLDHATKGLNREDLAWLYEEDGI